MSNVVWKKEVERLPYYRKIICALENYFTEKNWRKLFLTGGCYWFANILHQEIRDSIIMINRIEEHCALYFENGLYDVNGRISVKNFHNASEREISFMKKNYIPKFDQMKLEQYIQNTVFQNGIEI